MIAEQPRDIVLHEIYSRLRQIATSKEETPAVGLPGHVGEGPRSATLLRATSVNSRRGAVTNDSDRLPPS